MNATKQWNTKLTSEASGRIWTHRVPTPDPETPTNSGLGDMGLPGAEPVNVEIENGGETRTSVQRRDRDSASPILHVVFTHA